MREHAEGAPAHHESAGDEAWLTVPTLDGLLGERPALPGERLAAIRAAQDALFSEEPAGLQPPPESDDQERSTSR